MDRTWTCARDANSTFTTERFPPHSAKREVVSVNSIRYMTGYVYYGRQANCKLHVKTKKKSEIYPSV